MGYMRHHAIIVTSYSDEYVNKAKEKALSLDLICTEIIHSKVNDYYTFFIAPDGSKEFWDESDLGDKKRDLFVEWLNRNRYEDGSSPLDWVEVQYGDENGVQKVLRSSSDLQEPTPQREGGTDG